MPPADETPSPDPDLQARVEALEARVADLEAVLQRARDRRAARETGDAPARARRPRAKAAREPGAREKGSRVGVRWAEAKSEDVLGKVGIGLLLLGVLFLLKYSIDQGFLTPAVRVAGAGATGLALVGLGLRLRGTRPTLGRLLTGGGIAALYGTLWTASALYPLLPPVAALAGMAVTAALALVLASHEDDAALAVVGTLGALMTPLLLYRDPGQMGLLMGYTALVLAGAAAVYVRRGWPALVGAAAAGAWGVVLVAWVVGVLPESAVATGFDRTAFTLGALATWVATGLVPIGRRLSGAPTPADPFFDRWPRLFRPDSLAVFVAPLLAFGFLDGAWTLSAPVAAVGSAVLALGYAAAALAARGKKDLFGALVLAAASLAGWAAARALGLDEAFTGAVVVALGALVVEVARRERQGDLGAVGHAVALTAASGLGLYLFWVVGDPWGTLDALSRRDLTDALVASALAAGALGAVGFRSARGSSARVVHLVAAHLVVVLAVRVLLGPLANGPALTSLAWGVYGIALVVVGLRLRDDLLRQIGLGTVLVTVAKVLLVDLADIPGLWRVLLFMGLGGLLLLVSYLVPSLLRGETPEEGVGDRA